MAKPDPRPEGKTKPTQQSPEKRPGHRKATAKPAQGEAVKSAAAVPAGTAVAHGKPVQTAGSAQAGAVPKGTAAAQGTPAGGNGNGDGDKRGLGQEFEEKHGIVAALQESLRQAPAWLASMVVHMAVLLVLGLLVLRIEEPVKQGIIAESLDAEEEVEEINEEQFDEPTNLDMAEMVEQVPTENISETLEVSPNMEEAATATLNVELAEMSDIKALENDLLAKAGQAMGGDFDGRGNNASKKALIARYGGNEHSEKAVEMALEWLAQHQLPDGGWSFDHSMCPTCRGACSHPGSLGNGRLGATGMALLPFLGAGHTHKEGKYKYHVQRGLYYLATNMKPNGAMNESGGSMYSHGIASIAMTEAYAMTQDKTLFAPAQAAVNFIVSAQDRVGGGWRYSPGQAGDTSVVGWQLMALKSGAMGYLAVPPQSVQGATHFLDSVQANSGANYGYTGPGSGAATTAVGLLCRMYLGWKKDHPGMEAGVQGLAKRGPQIGRSCNMYYNYYATQVMHHYEGELWRTWNEKMRDFLVGAQDTTGHQKGSWHYAGGDHGTERGGRLYCTCMSTMTLEVYYRHLPIYRKQASEEDFDF